MPTRHFALVAALSFVIAGCGSNAEGEAQTAPAATPIKSAPYLTTDGDPIVSCGGGDSWPVSAMNRGIKSSIDRSEINAALERLVEQAGIDAPTALQGTDINDAEWFVLAETESTVTLALGAWTADGPETGAQTVGLEREDAAWHASRWGGCRLEPVLPAKDIWAQVLRSDSEVDPASTSVPVRVMEAECTSGRHPSPYLHEPVVVEDSDSVTVYWTSDAPTGNNNCPGNPAVERTITLTEPLADRVLLDGSSWPAAKLSRNPY